MDAPTRLEVRARSRLLRGRYPEVADPAEGDDLTWDIEDATVLVASITGRAIGPVAGEEVPAALVAAAKRAIALKAEQIDEGGTVENAQASAGGRRLRSISAGPWSESYFAPGELVVKGGVPQLDPDARLAELLWALATQDKRDEFIALATGVQTPAAALTEFDYRRTGGTMRGGGPLVSPRFGPDGF